MSGLRGWEDTDLAKLGGSMGRMGGVPQDEQPDTPEVVEQRGMDDLAQNEALDLFNKFEQEQAVVDAVPDEEKLPFMAVDTDKYGLPYYGAGFKGWARKTFANIFGEEKYEWDRTSTENQQAYEALSKGWENVADNLAWSQWGEKLFGVTAHEFGQAFGSRSTLKAEAEAKGEALGEGVATVAGEMGRVGQSLWNTGLGLAQTAEYVVRQGFAASLAQEDIADKASWANPLAGGEGLYDFFGIKGKPIGAVDTAVDAINILTFGNARNAINAARSASAVISGKADIAKIPGEYVEDIAKYAEGSSAVYTLFTNELAKENFNREVEAGADPAMAARNNENIWTELVVGSLLDPTSWLGTPIFKLGKAKVVVPVLGDVLEIGYGLTRGGTNITKAAIAKLTGKSPSYLPALDKLGIVVGQTPQLADVLGYGSKLGRGRLAAKGAEIGEGAGDIQGVLAKVDAAKAAGAKYDLLPSDVDNASRVIDTVEAGVDDFLSPFRLDDAPQSGIAKLGKSLTPKAVAQKAKLLFAYDTKSRAAMMGRTISPVIQVIQSMSIDMDTTMELLLDGMRAAKKDRAAMARLIMHPAAKIILSRDGITAMHMLNKFDEIGDLAKLAETANSKLDFSERLLARLDDVMGELTPGLDEMKQAARIVKEGGVPVVGEVKGARLIPPTPRQERLAEQWNKSTDPLIKWSRKWTAAVEKTNAIPVKFMGTVFMDWFAMGFYARNIMTSTVMVTQMFGATAAIETAGRALKSLDAKWTQDVLEANDAKLKKMLGFQHEAAFRAFKGKEERLFEREFMFSFHEKAVRAEQIMSSELALRSVERTMTQVLDIPELWNGLDDVMGEKGAQVFQQIAKEELGDLRAAAERYRRLGGSVPLEQTITVPGNLAKSYPNIKDRLLELRNKSLSPDELNAEVDAISKQFFEENAKAARAEPAGLGEGPDNARVIAEAEHLEGPEKDMFIRSVQGWRNAHATMTEALQSARDYLRDINKDAAVALDAEVKNIDKVLASRMAMKDDFNQTVVDISNNFKPELIPEYIKKLSSVKLVGIDDKGKVASKVFSMAEMFPKLDLAQLNQKRFVDLMWTFYFETRTSTFMASNTSNVSNKLSVFKTAFESLGQDFDAYASGPGKNLFKQMMQEVEEAKQYDSIFWNENFAMQRFLRNVNDVTLDQFLIPDALQVNGGLKHIFNMVNADRAERGADAAASMSEIGAKEWKASLVKHTASGEVKAKLPPPPLHGAPPSAGQIVTRGKENITKDFEAFKNAYANAYGKTKAIGTIGDEKKFAEWYKKTNDTLAVGRAKAAKIGSAERDFILHSYDKTYLEKALAVLSPFRYWTDHTKLTMAETLAANPRLLSSFLRYRTFLEKEHADMPEFYRKNIPVSGFFGIDKENPLFFNLERNFNPLDSIMGSDFNDPYKRADWLSRLVDDMGKSGATATLPLQWLVAANLFQKGENDAAQRWVGRLFPQTRMLKSTITEAQLALAGGDASKVTPLNFGPLIKDNEFDPFANAFNDGIDPYEEKRVRRALAFIVEQRVDTIRANDQLSDEQKRDAEATLRAQAIDEATAQEGAMWREALVRGIDARFAGEAMSFFLGQGFKARTEGDVAIENFYKDYNRFRATTSFMTAEQVRAGYDTLREKHPMMDMILLGNGGRDRDTSYAYNVLGRIPPGQSTDVLAQAGIDPQTIQRFYDDKGDMSAWDATERERFIANVGDLAAFLAVPDNTSRQEWTEARNVYGQVRNFITGRFGSDIYTRIDDFYKAPNHEQFLLENPAVAQAMEMELELKTTHPVLAKYYSGMDTLSRLYTTRLYDKLDAKYPEIGKVLDEYNRLKNTGDAKAYNKYKKQHPEIGRYYDERDRLYGELDRVLIAFGKKLPQAPAPNVRLDFDPSNPVRVQLAGLGQPAALPDVGPELRKVIEDYLTKNIPIPYSANNKLKEIATSNGYRSADELIRLYGVGQ